jgi:hypothetical protein
LRKTPEAIAATQQLLFGFWSLSNKYGFRRSKKMGKDITTARHRAPGGSGDGEAAGELYEPEGNFVIFVCNGKVTIAGYKRSGGNVRIPPAIRGLPVAVIGSGAFREKQLTGVTIPDGVTTIGAQAFFNNWLTHLAIPRSVVSVGRYAFARNQLTSVTIGAGVSITAESFDGDLANVYNKGKTAGRYTSANGGRTWS